MRSVNFVVLYVNFVVRYRPRVICDKRVIQSPEGKKGRVDKNSFICVFCLPSGSRAND